MSVACSRTATIDEDVMRGLDDLEVGVGRRDPATRRLVDDEAATAGGMTAGIATSVGSVLLASSRRTSLSASAQHDGRRRPTRRPARRRRRYVCPSSWSTLNSIVPLRFRRQSGRGASGELMTRERDAEQRDAPHRDGG